MCGAREARKDYVHVLPAELRNEDLSDITTVSDAAEISFLSACDDAIGKASVPKKIVLKH